MPLFAIILITFIFIIVLVIVIRAAGQNLKSLEISILKIIIIKAVLGKKSTDSASIIAKQKKGKNK